MREQTGNEVSDGGRLSVQRFRELGGIMDMNYESGVKDGRGQG